MIKGRKNMIKISKTESKLLNEKYGVNYGENGISIHGKTKMKKSHYLCESQKNMQYLACLRSSNK